MPRNPRSADIWATPRRPWGAALRDHWAVATDSVAFVAARLGTTLLVWLLVGIALALPAGLHLLDRNLARAAGDWQGAQGLTVYLQVGAAEAAAAALARRLTAHALIDTARIITPEEALAELGSHLGVDLLATLSENPLPATIVAAAKPDLPVARLRAIAERIRGDAQVDAVVLETAWLARLAAIRALVERIEWIAAVLFGVGAVLVSSASIRLAIEVRLPELQVHALVGASRRYMGRPFRYLGLIYGAGGGIVAALLVAAAITWLRAPLARLYGGAAQGPLVVGFDGPFVIGVLAIGVALGLLGAAISVRSRLRNLAME